MNSPINTTPRGPHAATPADRPGNVVDLAAFRRAAERRRTGTASQPRSGLPGLAEADTEAAIDGPLALALGDLLKRSRTADRVAALAVIRFTERRLLEETYGRAIAARLDARLQARLGAVLRPGDRCLPLEHDTFVVLLHDLAAEGSAMTETRRLCRETGGTVQLDGFRFTLTSKAGVAVTPADGAEPDTLLRYARIAMRHAAACTTSDVQRYKPHMLSAMREQVAMAGELQQAIDDDRLELHYQPQYALGSGELVSAEALMRLRDETGALVMPDRFIGIAEETGLIVEMGRWAIETACRQLADWRAEGRLLRHVAVNLSPRQLLDSELIPTIKAAVLKAGLAFTDLELELTEAQMIENLPLVNNVLDEIAALGVRIAVDDFGTGYSSLAYLSRLPLHRLKIDRSLVQAATADRRAAQIVAAVVAMARELGLKVTAEGIETEAHHRLVTEAGCHLGQGFLMARPVPAANLHG
jgi:EAL domain-containing protein (putative c-di-GMP-specific phosphodiesterase class I)/GGDEF domain-containing protein